ncbi:MAG: hypothetical protein OFPII_38240 [Osedax symbiont Rs1]|nr:MAG: hypothetical protein OFPII_38240 [Osedax symbiont Rs1]
MQSGLNHYYRLIWNAVQHCWVVVGELGKGRGKKSKGISALVGMAIAISGLLMPNLSSAAPVLSQIQQGQGSVDQQGAITTINQQSQQLSLDWQSFNVQAHEQVNFIQPNRQSIAINTILDNQGSKIHGQINANGQVWLVNPNGILFGEHAQVNVGGIVASSLALSSKQGDTALFIKDVDSTLIQNDGYIQTSSGGYIALIGAQVRNTGTLVSEGGNISLAAGSTVNLTFAGEALLSLDIQQSTLDNLVDNRGLIRAQGGRVLMNAGAKDSLLASVVNNQGVIEARGVVEQNGEIILLSGMTAGTTYVDGTLDASAKVDAADGGFIETSGHKVKVAASTVITTQSVNKSGLWLIDPEDFTVAATGGDMDIVTLEGYLSGGNWKVETESTGTGNGDIFINDAVSWNANTTLTLSAYRNIEINASITATGANGKVDLKYGQGAVASGNTASYSIDTANNAQVNLQQGLNFSTTLGFDGVQIDHTVITSLGAQGSTTGTDLQGMRGGFAGHYVLGANIDASGTVLWNGGKGFAAVGGSTNQFSGSLDGLGHSIDQLFIDKPNADYQGLIGKSSLNSRVSNIALTSVDITAKHNVGGLIGDSRSMVNNSSVTGVISGNSQVGGLIGIADQGSVNNSYTAVVVDAVGDSTGGLIGSSGVEVSNSYATGAVDGGSGRWTGGLIGNGAGNVSHSYATGAVDGREWVGGLIGLLSSAKTVNNSYAAGAVEGFGLVGGLIGFVAVGNVSNSYATGSVSAVNIAVGGLIGRLDHGSVSTSYATGLVSGTSTFNPVDNGLIGYISAALGNINTVSDSFWNKDTSGQIGSAGAGATVVGKTSTEMQQSATFSAWDTSTWRIYEGSTTPLLKSFLTAYSDVIDPLTTQYDGSNLVTLTDHLYANTLSADAGIYAVSVFSDQQGFDLSNESAMITIAPKSISLSATRVYDGTTDLSLSLLSTDDLVGSDSLNYSGLVNLAAKDAGTQTIIIDALMLNNSNYQLAGPHLATINPMSTPSSSVQSQVSNISAALLNANFSTLNEKFSDALITDQLSGDDDINAQDKLINSAALGR